MNDFDENSKKAVTAHNTVFQLCSFRCLVLPEEYQGSSYRQTHRFPKIRVI